MVIKVSDNRKAELNEIIVKNEEVKKMDFIPFFLQDAVRDKVLKSERKGERKGKLEMIKQMLADNMPLEVISKYSGFPKSQIQKLAHSN